MWISLILFQLIRFSIFYALLNIHWMSNKMLGWALLSISTDLLIVERLLKFFGCDSDYFSPKIASGFVRWNALSAAILAFILPLIVLIFIEVPWRYLPDGPLFGPVSVTELPEGDVRGVVEFRDGSAFHDYGGGIETTVRSSRLTYADPFVTEQWDPSVPVRVWAIHGEYEELSADHRFGYVVSWKYGQRNFYNRIVARAMSEHDLKATEDMILVKLDSRGPRFEQGPTLLQFILGLYVFVGLYLGFTAYAVKPRRELQLQHHRHVD